MFWSDTMLNEQTYTDRANKIAIDACKGNAEWLECFSGNPYELRNGVWYFKGEELDKISQRSLMASTNYFLDKHQLSVDTTV
jgi:hypothetical protein